MRKITAILFLLAVLMSLTTPVLGAKPSLYTATGGGTLMNSYYDYTNTYTFNVQQLDEEGHAKGRLMINFGVGSEYQSKLEADLMYVAVEGNTAWMSGVITKGKGYVPFNERKSVLFGVQDNGEGKNGEPDKISPLCSTKSDVLVDYAINETRRKNYLGIPENWFDLTNGNIQVA